MPRARSTARSTPGSSACSSTDCAAQDRVAVEGAAQKVQFISAVVIAAGAADPRRAVLRARSGQRRVAQGRRVGAARARHDHRVLDARHGDGRAALRSHLHDLRGKKVLDGTLAEIRRSTAPTPSACVPTAARAALDGMPGVEKIVDQGNCKRCASTGRSASVPAGARGAHRGAAVRGRAAVVARHLRAHRAAGGAALMTCRRSSPSPKPSSARWCAPRRSSSACSLLPILILGLSFAQKQLAKHADTSTKRFAVSIRAAATTRPSPRRRAQRDARWRPAGQEGAQAVVRARARRRRRPRARRAARSELSERVRKEELFAFVEIPAEPRASKLRYYSDHPAYDDLRDWMAEDPRRQAARRLLRRGAPRSRAHRRAGEQGLGARCSGLWTRDADGHIHPAEKQDEVRAVVMPMAAVFLLFFFVVSSAPQLMNSVLTEKMSRISEVLLGSLTPTELMTGKLLGSVGGVAAARRDLSDGGAVRRRAHGLRRRAFRRRWWCGSSCSSCWRCCSTARYRSPSARPATTSRTRRT